MDEIWKDIPNTDYSVSNMGRVESRKRSGIRVLRPVHNGGGYSSVVLFTNGAKRMCKVHQLVAAAFLPPRPTPKHEINHKNGMKRDNQADNLEWVTHAENAKHRFDVLGHRGAHGESHGNAKLTELKVREIRLRHAAGESKRDIAASLGIHKETVSKIVRGRSWSWLK